LHNVRVGIPKHLDGSRPKHPDRICALDVQHGVIGDLIIHPRRHESDFLDQLDFHNLAIFNLSAAQFKAS
jgi:hypothetical protein